MKSLVVLLFTGLFTMTGLNAQQVNKDRYAIICSTRDCLKKNENKDATIEGLFRKFTPWERGKGAGHMFWDWEIMLKDSTTVPVNSADKKIDYKSFEGKRVRIKGNIFLGVIIGNPEPGYQQYTGFRIDPVEIEEKK